MKAFPQKKLKHNICRRVENSVVTGRNACVEKGFNVQNSVILVNLKHSKWDPTSDNAQDRRPELNHIRQWKTYRKERAGKYFK